MFNLVKKLILGIDKKLFGGKYKRFYIDNIENVYYRLDKKDIYSYGYTSQYRSNKNSQINKLCKKYGTDKGGDFSLENKFDIHNYSDIYDLLFRLHKQDVKLLIECGIGTNNPKLESSMGLKGSPGASLKMWRDYFPKAKIIGVDIDKDILFSDERIETYYCDQLDKKSITLFLNNAKLKETSADVIIDDGLHNFEAGKSFFEGTIDLLDENGIYIIEDVSIKDLSSYKEYFSKRSKIYTAHFMDLKKTTVKMNDNRLIIIFKNN